MGDFRSGVWFEERSFHIQKEFQPKS